MRFAELKADGKVVVTKCFVARDFFSRFMGLMGRKSLPAEEAIVFPKCNSIHTFFMRMPIDVLFVSETGEIVEVMESLAPWRMLLPRKGVRHIVELRSRGAKDLGLRSGAQLKLPGVWE